MDEKTLTALQGSIAKWQAIVDGTGADLGTDNCPLCQMFFEQADDMIDGCTDCPVAKKTGDTMCEGTPYVAWGTYTWDNRERSGAERIGDRWSFKVFDEESRKRAQAELDFLKALLPQRCSDTPSRSTR